MNDKTAVIEIPTVIGARCPGGFYIGRIRSPEALYGVAVAPRAIGYCEPMRWNKSVKSIVGARSYWDGFANTEAMAAAGSELAQWMRALRFEGFDDYYLGARDEVELQYRKLKPGKYATDQWRAGDNPSSVPPGYPYTAAGTLQTGVEAFWTGGEEAFDEDWHWSSTQYAPDGDCAWAQHFTDGGQDTCHKDTAFRARAVRRFVIQSFTNSTQEPAA